MDIESLNATESDGYIYVDKLAALDALMLHGGDYDLRMLRTSVRLKPHHEFGAMRIRGTILLRT